MRLDCLGSGFAFSHGAYWSGFLLDGRVLLDCPPQTLPHLFRLDVPTSAVDLVLLSHEHSDHIGGVDLFLLEERRAHDAAAERTNPLAIAGPPGIHDRLREVVGTSSRLPDRDDPRIAWFEQRGGSAFEWAGAQVECVAMDHAPDIDALGFRVRLPGGVVAYSGDTGYGEALLSLAEGADLLIAECGGDREHGHMTWDHIRALRAAVDPSTRLLVTHYDPLAVPDWARALDGVELAEDFAVYEI
ncbi:MAG: MBL fold metallo-hydrolase [Chloroflexi bacterium]|nr:MBL fold metallo-hydrolase [Chloroflexota bacterium]